LKAEATPDQILLLCQAAADLLFAAVCVQPCYVDLAAHALAGTGVKVATVIGFPLGANLTATKVFEVQAALKDKANELDMVINLGAAKSGCWEAVEQEIAAVVQAAETCAVKVIIETGLLTADEIRRASSAVVTAGAAFVKTSTGFGPRGASVEDIALIKSVVGDFGIKASGGIKTKAQALAMIAAGATRIGTSCGLAILD
jgi:deoxyribose-phosphate aldolase